jgi:rSAM/selenodomain-associated transferase 2/rSAM/selenodomain-associated transferase 1
MTQERIVIFTRYPEPGQAKTRLIPALGAVGAADLHRQMTEYTLVQVKQLQQSRSTVRGEIHFSGPQGFVEMQAWLDEDWLYHPQGRGDLGDRLIYALTSSLQANIDSVLVIGTDCPELTAELMAEALDRLQTHDLVLGPATDGGYYLIGLRSPIPELFTGIPWGTDTVLRRTVAIAQALNLSITYLPTLDDVDRPEDLPVWERIHGVRDPAKPKISKLSVIIPVLNEAKTLPDVLTSTAADSEVEIIVVDGGSVDDTMAIAQSYGVNVLSSSGGRALQMNAGAAAATGEILLFLHADTQLPTGYDQMVRATLNAQSSKPPVIAGAFTLYIDAPRWTLRLVEWGVNWRSRFLQLPYGDQAIFLKADTFHNLGGFPELPIMEDFELVCQLRRLGSIIILSTPVVTSARRWLKKGVFQTTLLNQIIIAGYLLGISPQRLANGYRQGKFWTI